MHSYFFEAPDLVYLLESSRKLNEAELAKVEWLTAATLNKSTHLKGDFVGPRKEMISPWSSNATDIIRNMGIEGVTRIEHFQLASDVPFDPMLQAQYEGLNASSLVVDGQPVATFSVEDIRSFNKEVGLALSEDEIEFLESSQKQLKRLFTDVELFAFAQINSEHCRHKIFNGTFIIDGVAQKKSLFQLIKDTSAASAENIVSAYSDNVAYIKGNPISQFIPSELGKPSFFQLRPARSIISLKAETHNFPTTVEPFYGASTGSGGEIRDRMAGGLGGIPLIGTAVYMTALPRLEGGYSEKVHGLPKERKWKYQSPEQILIKASVGASDFGNKFGQPLTTGSILTYEGETSKGLYGFDRCVMLAGGVGYSLEDQAKKKPARRGDKLVLLGGDNYRIGMAGGSVSSVDTGKVSSAIELSAVQRANPEMQKRVYNTIRALVEASDNPIRIIHDHGAGGHVNCFSEILEATGGKVHIAALPVGDKTLSVREILCNESQERMGLLVGADDVPRLIAIATRERAPLYVVGEIDESGTICFEAEDKNAPFNVPTQLLFGASPKTELKDEAVPLKGNADVHTDFRSEDELLKALRLVLSSETVACKDWLTNKVDRCVTGRVVQQQGVGPLHLPLSNVAIAALDYSSGKGVATAIGHAPVIGLIDERAGSVLSVVEALTNIVWAPLDGGLESVALSANWMWPAKQPGEDVRLYRAVEALSDCAIKLGIPVPTGKDSLSMTMNYEDGSSVRAPGTVIVSAVAPSISFIDCVTPDLKQNAQSHLLYIDCSSDPTNPLGGSIYAQSRGVLGAKTPNVSDLGKFKDIFNTLQSLIKQQRILAGHDVSSGGLITTLCEMSFAGNIGITVKLDGTTQEIGDFLFCEKPGVVLQVAATHVKDVIQGFSRIGVTPLEIGALNSDHSIKLEVPTIGVSVELSDLRSTWFQTSYLLDRLQTKPEMARKRFENVGRFPLTYRFPEGFNGKARDYGIDFERTKRSGLNAAVIREQGSNGERELAYSMYLAGFDVKDVTMSDLIAGRETLEDVQFIGFPGGFANSDVCGAAKGWASSFKYNDRAMQALTSFMKRPDTLSIGICNGCQLMVALNLLYPEHKRPMQMGHNASGRFECTFINVEVERSESIFLKPLEGSRLGVWVAHGEGNFSLPEGENAYEISARFVTGEYPANPNGSDFNAAAVSSRDGRHLVIMPHLERSAMPWNWAFYPHDLKRTHQVSPWVLAFCAARDWIQKKK